MAITNLFAREYVQKPTKRIKKILLMEFTPIMMNQKKKLGAPMVNTLLCEASDPLFVSHACS